MPALPHRARVQIPWQEPLSSSIMANQYQFVSSLHQPVCSTFWLAGERTNHNGSTICQYQPADGLCVLRGGSGGGGGGFSRGGNRSGYGSGGRSNYGSR